MSQLEVMSGALAGVCSFIREAASHGTQGELLIQMDSSVEGLQDVFTFSAEELKEATLDVKFKDSEATLGIPDGPDHVFLIYFPLVSASAVVSEVWEGDCLFYTFIPYVQRLVCGIASYADSPTFLISHVCDFSSELVISSVRPFFTDDAYYSIMKACLEEGGGSLSFERIASLLSFKLTVEGVSANTLAGDTLLIDLPCGYHKLDITTDGEVLLLEE